MLTRGFLIGEIIDNLSNIQTQVKSRCKLGLTDLNKYVEDFFKDILNITIDSNLINLNDNRCNEPGIDLGDEGKSLAFQVTSQNTAAKINNTIEKITEEQIHKYSSINIFIVGEKKTSYSCTTERFKFDGSNIWDINYLLTKVISLPLDRIKSLYDLISKDLIRVKIELEIPDENGHFPTSLSDYAEKIPSPVVNECCKYAEYIKEISENDSINPESLAAGLECFSKKLLKLPRITREFLCYLLENKEENISNMHECYEVNYDKITRLLYRYSDIDGEIKLLEFYKFSTMYLAESNAEVSKIRIYYGVTNIGGIEYCLSDIVSFADKYNISYKKVFVCLDFSDY
jgi:hypothetical protein